MSSIKYGKGVQDEIWWNEIRRGNQKAFVELYNAYADDLLKYGCHLVKDKYLVEDILHDLFVSLWGRKSKLSNVRAIKLYLMTAMRRMLQRRIRTDSIWQVTDNLSHKFEINSSSFLDTNLQGDDEAETVDKIRKAVNNLSIRQKEIIYLKFYHNFSYQEIAQLMDLDQKYTYNLAARAIKNLKEQFGKICYINCILFGVLI